MMRRFDWLMLSGLALAAVPSLAQAEVTYPFCQMDPEMGSENCGYTSLAQCRAALAGGGGHCIANPRYSEKHVESSRRRR